MRAILEPFELQPDIDESGWLPSVANAFVYGTPILDLNGNGGEVSFSRTFGSDAYIRTPVFPIRTAMAISKAHFYSSSLSVAERMQFVEDNGTRGIGYRKINTTGAVGIYRNSTLLATSVGSLNALQNYLMELVCVALNSGGSAELFVDGVSFVSYTGDTLASGSYISQGEWNVLNNSRLDNMTIDIPSLSYDGGTGGAAALGETVTGATSGATALIGGIDGDATSGRLALYNISGVFVDDEQITTGGTFDALLNAPTIDYVDGLEPFSSRPGNEHIVVGMPNANGATSGLTGSDGNSTDNYLLVNDAPPDSADYVESTNTGSALLDTYGIDFSNLPASGDISAITCVGVVAQMVSDLTGVDHANLMVRQGSTDYASPDAQGNDDDIDLPLGQTCSVRTWDTQPDGSGGWDRTAAVALEAGTQLKP